jgi:hypothetical protein
MKEGHRNQTEEASGINATDLTTGDRFGVLPKTKVMVP